MRRSGGGTDPFASASTRPATAIRPRSGRSSPAIARSVVVLPQPDGPSRHTNSPSATLNERSRTAGFRPERDTQAVKLQHRSSLCLMMLLIINIIMRAGGEGGKACFVNKLYI